MISNQNRISGLVIEMHDCDIHLEVIEDFIKNFELKLIHIHANNNAPIRLDDKLPLVLELTFSKHCDVVENSILPDQLDSPNNKNKPEITLLF